jgi:hypothetical protein
LLQKKLYFFILLEKVMIDNISEFQDLFDTCILESVKSENRNLNISIDHSISFEKKQEELKLISKYYQNVSIDL